MSKLTPREVEIVVAGLQCYDSQPKVNYEKLAQLCNLKTAASAKTSWLMAKKKLFANAPTGDNAAAASPSKKAPATAGTKRKSATSGPAAKRGKKNAKSNSPEPLPAEDDEEIVDAVKKEEEGSVDGDGEVIPEGGAVRAVDAGSRA